MYKKNWFESEQYNAARRRIDADNAIDQEKMEKIPVEEAKRRIGVLYQRRFGHGLGVDEVFIADSPYEGKLASRAGINYDLGYNKGAC